MERLSVLLEARAERQPVCPFEGAADGLAVVVMAVLERTAVVQAQEGGERWLVRFDHLHVKPETLRWTTRSRRDWNGAMKAARVRGRAKWSVA
jgi:hypothetical protein